MSEQELAAEATANSTQELAEEAEDAIQRVRKGLALTSLSNSLWMWCHQYSVVILM